MSNYPDQDFNEQENYGFDNEQWQRENIGLRAGKGSSYDRFNIKSGGQGWRASEGFREHVMNDRSGHVHNEEQREYALNHGTSPMRDEQMARGRRRIHSLNFNEYAGEGNRIINEVADELGCNRDTAARILRAVLHAVRDRVPADDAVQFAQGLPMALKGVFFDQYDISRTPVIIRSAADFIEFIREKNRFAAVVDFPYPQSVVRGLQAVFRVLERNMDYGQVRQIVNLMPGEVQSIIHQGDMRSRM